jgi:DNA-binding PadR family transcriptional regulator
MFHGLWHPHHHHHGHHPHGERGEFWVAGHRGGPWGGGRGGFFSRGGGADWFGDFFGPPPRADRGGVRYLVLDALRERDRHGYEVIQAIEERSGGAYRPSPGVVYPTLQLLEELGHAQVAERESRKVYTITDEGRRDLEAHTDEVKDFYDRFDDTARERQMEDFGDLMRQVARLLKTFKRAARHGHLSAKVQASIREVLNDAVQRIETILTESER